MDRNEEELRPLSLIPFGAPGVGKSNILNKLLNKEIFVSTSSATTGVTKTIRFETGYALGIPNAIRLIVCDAPGVGDLKMSL